jgi:hypothetical protein
MAEPVFLLRGQDPTAAAIVHRWADMQRDENLKTAVHRWALFMNGYAEAKQHGPATVDLTLLRTDLLDGIQSVSRFKDL